MKTIALEEVPLQTGPTRHPLFSAGSLRPRRLCVYAWPSLTQRCRERGDSAEEEPVDIAPVFLASVFSLYPPYLRGESYAVYFRPGRFERNLLCLGGRQGFQRRNRRHGHREFPRILDELDVSVHEQDVAALEDMVCGALH